MKFHCIAHILGMLMPVMAFAEDNEDFFSEFGDEDLISIATGYDKPISKAPAVATVITQSDIHAIGATDLDDVLETVPGLHVARDALGYNPIYVFRGIYSSLNPQVLMLVNGVPFKSLFQGDRHLAWGGMPVENISRIEIIRGPGSAVYGADAFAGVINIVTKQGDEAQGLRTGARAGSFDTTEAWISYGHTNGNFKYLFSLEYEDTNGQREAVEADAQSILDFVGGTSLSLAPGSVNVGREAYDFRADVGWEFWRFQAGYQRREGQTGVGAAQALDPNGLVSSDRYSVSLGYKQPEFSESWQLEASTSYRSTTQEVEQDIFLFPAGSTGGPSPFPFPNGIIGNPEVFEHHFHIDASALYTAIKDHEIRIGSGYYLGDLFRARDERNFTQTLVGQFPVIVPLQPDTSVVDVSDTPLAFITEGARTNKYLFIQDIWHLDNDWELTAGLRYDDYSDFGSTVNPRLALVWSTSHNLTTKFLYGEAFRAPSFAQTRAINNPSILGNPDLMPEELKSYEVAFDYKPMLNLHLDANLFFYKWDDIILFEPDPAGRRAQNAGEQTGYGLELNAEWEASDRLTLSGNFSWQDSTDERTGTSSGNAPSTQLYLRSDWQLASDWHWNLQVNWVAGRDRVAVDVRPELDDYLIVDSKLSYQPSDQSWEVALIVKNLFDDDAREPSPGGDVSAPIPLPALIPNDLPLAGRAVFAEFRYQFGQ
ncbi:TonB-dependent receptor [bacterium SCSIO 12696]|nr:TonB-dependent receptor [bacterium SCSIO 12696]